MPAKRSSSSFSTGGVTPASVVDRFEHAFRRRRAAHLLPAAELVPDLAVMRRSSARTGRSTSPTRSCTCSVGITRRSFDERLVLEIGAARIFGRQVRLDAQRRADLRERRARPPRETSCMRLSDVSQLGGGERAREHRPPPASAAERERFVARAGARRRPAASRSPPARGPATHQRDGDQHDVEPDQPVLELARPSPAACSRPRAPRRRPAPRRRS